MWKHLEIVNPEALKHAEEDLRCRELQFLEIDGKDFQIPPTDIAPPEGYTPKEGFPNCCEFHSHVFNSTADWYKKFPECCSGHKKLLSTKWFDKTRYKDVASKVSNQLAYTEHIIYERINKDDWYEDITDYIEFSHYSFGQLPTGYPGAPGLVHYLNNLLHELKELTAKKEGPLPPEKLERLSDFVKRFYETPGRSKVDLNQLNVTYKNWLKMFPFRTSYFRELKSRFEGQLPILKGPVRTNRYMKISRASVKTQTELIQWLIDTTKALLTSINTSELLDKKIILDTKQHELDLLKEEHRISQSALLSTLTKGEEAYVVLLKTWMRNEKNFFTQLNSIIRSESTSIRLQFPPANEYVFEDLVCDLYNELYPDAFFKPFGKKGDKQKGLDIISISKKIGIQCKEKDLTRSKTKLIRELKKDFLIDLEKTLSLDGVEIDTLIFTSTFTDSAMLEEALQKTAKELKVTFSVMYVGWSTLAAKLQGFDRIVKKYYSG